MIDMRLTSAVLLLTSASMSLNAMNGADVTPLINNVSQFENGVGSDAANLIDGNASTECRLPGASFTVKLAHGITETRHSVFDLLYLREQPMCPRALLYMACMMKMAH